MDRKPKAAEGGEVQGSFHGGGRRKKSSDQDEKTTTADGATTWLLEDPLALPLTICDGSSAVSRSNKWSDQDERTASADHATTRLEDQDFLALSFSISDRSSGVRLRSTDEDEIATSANGSSTTRLEKDPPALSLSISYSRGGVSGTRMWTDQVEMTTSAEGSTTVDADGSTTMFVEDPLALSLSISRPSDFVCSDLNVVNLATGCTSSAPPTGPLVSSTDLLKFQVSGLQPPPPHQQTVQPDPPLPASHHVLYQPACQDDLPTHPVTACVPAKENTSQFAPQPSCLTPPPKYGHINEFVPSPAAGSSIPVSVPVQQQQPHPYSLPSIEQRQQQPPPQPVFSRLPPRRRPRSKVTFAEGKQEFITPPYPWATNRRARVDTLDVLLRNGITNITGRMRCKKCTFDMEMSYQLQAKFTEVFSLIVEKFDAMHNRALPEWMNPAFPPCPSCQTRGCLRPVIANKKRNINWLFMMLGQTIGACTLEQLKYFCKHTGQHRAGAKDRLVFSAYIGICKQLNPDCRFQGSL